ncbi:MAG: secE [Desulfacinum sp.]|jgi:preprotein translocase subunit SecE|nr:secE [Desulfacinum sp.]
MKAAKASHTQTMESGGPPVNKKSRKHDKQGDAKAGDVKKMAAAKKKAPRKVEASGPNLWTRFRTYLREVVYELRKVVWPSRKETIGSTSVVLVIVILCGLFLGFVDLILSRFVRFLIG